MVVAVELNHVSCLETDADTQDNKQLWPDLEKRLTLRPYEKILPDFCTSERSKNQPLLP